MARKRAPPPRSCHNCGNDHRLACEKPCFNCGKRGHVFADCTKGVWNRPPAKVMNVFGLSQDYGDNVWFRFESDRQDFVPVERGLTQVEGRSRAQRPSQKRRRSPSPPANDDDDDDYVFKQVWKQGELHTYVKESRAKRTKVEEEEDDKPVVTPVATKSDAPGLQIKGLANQSQGLRIKGAAERAAQAEQTEEKPAASSTTEASSAKTSKYNGPSSRGGRKRGRGGPSRRGRLASTQEMQTSVDDRVVAWQWSRATGPVREHDVPVFEGDGQYGNSEPRIGNRGGPK